MADRLDLLVIFVEGEKERRRLEAALKAVKEKQAQAKDAILTQVFEAGVGFQNITLDGLTVYLHRQLWANAESGRKRELCAALKAEGLGDFVSETFHTGTLSSWVRERWKEGDYRDLGELKADLPEAIRQHISVAERFDIRSRAAG